MNIIGIICGVVVAVGRLIVFLCQLIKNDIENVIVFIVTRLAIAIAAGLTVAMALSI